MLRNVDWVHSKEGSSSASDGTISEGMVAVMLPQSSEEVVLTACMEALDLASEGGSSSVNPGSDHEVG